MNYIGNNFFELMQDPYNTEDYVLTQLNGEEWVGRISLEAKTSSTYMMEEREYLQKGTATFPDIDAQTTFRGCYFHRAINPHRTYILVSTIPEPTDGRIGDVFAVECNETVKLAYLEEQINEKHDTITVPVPFAEDVQVYFDTTLQKQRRSSDGNFEQTLYYMQIPARYGLSEDQVVLRKSFVWNNELKKNELVDTRYRVESVTLSMTTTDNEGNIYGIMDVQMSIDTRE